MGARSSAKIFLGFSDPGVQQQSLQRRIAWALHCEEAYILSTMTLRSIGKYMVYMSIWFISLARSGNIDLLMSRTVLFYSLSIISKTFFLGSTMVIRMRHWRKTSGKKKLPLLGLLYCSLSITHPMKRHQNKKWASRTSLVVWWLRLHTPNAGVLGLISGQGTRSHLPQLRTWMLQLSPDTAKYIDRKVLF